MPRASRSWGSTPQTDNTGTNVATTSNPNGQHGNQQPQTDNRGTNGPRAKWIGLTTNVTAYASLLALLAEREVRDVDFLAVQETHLRPDQCADAEAKLGQMGWLAVAHPAHGALPGYSGSGGCIQMVRKGHGLAACEVLGSPVLAAGRAVVHCCSGVLDGGFAWVNLYLESGSGLNATNLHVLGLVAQRLHAMAMPFIVAGDFNLSPPVLESSGVLSLVGGRVVAPEFGTVTPSHDILDYYVVSPHFVQARAFTLLGMPTKPHRPVKLILENCRAKPLVQIMKAPKCFPIEAPAGCTNKDFSQGWQDARDNMHTATLDQAWRLFATQAEAQLADVYQIEAADADRYAGRANDPKLVRVPMSRASAPRFPRLSPTAVWMRKTSICFRFMARTTGMQWAQSLREASKLIRVAPTAVLQAAGCQPWLVCLARAAVLPLPFAAALSELASYRSEQLAREAARTSNDQFSTWVQAQLDAGAGALHAASKLPLGFQSSSLTATCKTADITGEMQILVAEWQKWWCVADARPDLDWPEDLGERPPRPSVETMRAVLKTFKARTACAFDSLKPRQLLYLDDAGLEAFIDLIMMCERQADWPLMSTKIIFLQKRLGGLRPIALIALVARVQARLRRSVLVSWEKANDRAFFWASKGKACNRAVWQQSVWSEWATVQGERNQAPEAWASASVFLDLLKAFETIRHERLLDAAMFYGFPLWQLKLCIQLYRAPRYLTLQNVVSSPVSTLQAVLPGHGPATTLVRLILLKPLDDMFKLCPRVQAAVVVDDLILQRQGEKGRVVHDLVQSSNALADGLVEQCLSVSRKKTAVLANIPEVRTRVLAGVRRKLGGEAKTAERNLGIDFAAGQRVRSTVRAGRLKLARARVPKVKKFHVKGVQARATQRVAQAGLQASFQYGVDCTGLTNQQLSIARTIVFCACEPRTAGKSRTLSLMLQGRGQLDPAFRAARAPVEAMASALWQTWLPKHVLATVCTWASQHVLTWAQVKGPGGALVLTLARLGWTLHEFPVWRSHKGVLIDFSQLCPRTILKLVDQAVEAWQWSQVAAGEGLEHLHAGCNLALLRRLTSRGRPPRSLADVYRTLQVSERAYLRSVIVNGQWPMVRKAAVGNSASAACLKCQAPRGSLWHRHLLCSSSWPHLEMPSAVANLVPRENMPPVVVLVERCLWPLPLHAFQPPQDEHVTWVRGSGIVEGPSVYEDGTAFESQFPDLCVCGWALVSIGDGPGTPQQRVNAKVTGLLCEPVPDIDGAELLAIIHVLIFSMPPIHVYSDSDFVVKGILERGEAATTHPKAAWAHLWRRFWKLLDEFGGLGPLGLLVSKIKAHATVADVQAGRVRDIDRTGNSMADEAAKEAVRPHRAPPALLSRFQQCDQFVLGVGLWIAMAGAVAADHDTTHKKTFKRSAPTLQLYEPKVVHSVVSAGGAVWCRVCRSVGVTPGGECGGSVLPRAVAASRALAAEGRRPHRLLEVTLSSGSPAPSHPVVVCEACGYGASNRILAPLLAPCNGKPSEHGGRTLKQLIQGFMPGSRKAATCSTRRVELA